MQPVSPEQRQQLLSMAVYAEVARGAQVQSMDQTSALLLKVDTVNHIFHLLMTAFTCGVWAVVWLLVTASARARTFRLVVDEFGIVQHSDQGRSDSRSWEPHDGLWWRGQNGRP
ncbi:hypothetical protein [Nocardia sp. AG03]|uniref:hypothetical protein n=1 Tax=Nocardia sp. AG03 TaxID=3025312 RepID=UPI0024186399|nr:hypothetical protein [Nocardia sp. AG03]